MSFVTDDAASSALDWLLGNAKAIGDAKRNAVLTEAMTKRVKAIQMLKSNAKTVAERENEALASDEYLEAVIAEADAAGHLETMRGLKDAATARIECWRSLTSTARQLRAA